MKEINHQTGAKETVLTEDEVRSYRKIQAIKQRPLASELDLTDADVKTLVFHLAKNAGIIKVENKKETK